MGMTKKDAAHVLKVEPKHIRVLIADAIAHTGDHFWVYENSIRDATRQLFRAASTLHKDFDPNEPVVISNHRKGDGTVYLRGKVWYIRYYRDKQPVTLACPGLTEAQARTKLKHEMRKRDDEFIAPSEKRVTIAELIADAKLDYASQGRDDLSQYTDRRWELHLKPFFGELKAHQFNTDKQREYRTLRLKEGASVATINRELQVMRHAFTLGYEAEPAKVKRLPKFIFIEEDNARQGFVTVQQFDALRAACASRGLEFRVFLELAILLGWRRGEMLNLHVRNVRLFDGKTGVIRLDSWETKNGKPREIPLNQTLKLFLAPMVADRRGEDKLFHLTVGALRFHWPEIIKEAGCPDLLVHDLRRSSARTKVQAGINENTIMKMQGWTTNAMFRRYAIVSMDDMHAALAKQEQFEKKALGGGE